jgi:DNA primase large subunit
MDEDRLTPILDHLSKGFLAGISSEYSSAPEHGESITAEMIDAMAVKHFPLCMRSLHNGLREDSHLKHQGRLQYGLFLKVRTTLPSAYSIMLTKSDFGLAY